ncbi:MAG: CDP-alcohol phosphatidyltransferase family protein [Gemmatimonadales bacterium]
MPEKHDPGFLTVSNLLSLSRIPLGVMFLVTNDPKALALIVVAGSLTDLLDGVIARISGTISEVGILLDPFCDKIFVLLGVVSFLPSGRLDWAGFVILILRDVFTGGSYLVSRLVGRDMHPRSRMGGKVTTFFQFLTLLALIFRPGLVPIFILAVGITSVYAIIDYGVYLIKQEQFARLDSE